MDREKEIKYLIYLKNQLIKQTKKEIKILDLELKQYYGEKKMVKGRKHERNR